MEYVFLALGLIILLVIALAAGGGTRPVEDSEADLHRIADEKCKKCGAHRWYLQSVHGESFANADGNRRQDILKRCKSGDEIDLVPEPDNPFDHNAIAVRLVKTGEQLGYLPSVDAARMLADNKRGWKYAPFIFRVIGGTREKRSRGVVLVIFVFNKEEAEAVSKPA